MNNKTFLTIHAVVYGFFALALFFLPGTLWPVYGVEINDQYARFLSQHNSIFLGGIAALVYLLRDIQDQNVVTRLLKGLLVTNCLGVVITLYACLTGIFAGFGWSDPMFFGLLAGLSLWQIKRSR